jgi:branched-chain amino acid transport system ATP-binding protein
MTAELGPGASGSRAAGVDGALLDVDRVEAFYGKSQILRALTFGVARGGITALLGRNGMGKTTTLRAIMGLTPPRSGRVRLDGREITGLASHHIARLGVGYVPEGRQLFPHLDVGENLRLAELSGRGSGRWTLDAIFEYFPILRERWRQKARSLSGGEQQMLAIARALAGNPLFIMLDEPSQGLAPLLVREVGTLLARLRQDGLTILLVEQNTRLALAVADHVLVLHRGTVVFSGTLEDFRREEDRLRGSYLAV